MEIEIKEVITQKDLREFVKFPLSLYKNNTYYVPPIIKEEILDLEKTKNPVFYHAKAYYFLAYKATRIVGRIAAIINNYEIEKQKKQKIRFGWFDVIDDINVTKKLIEKVAEIGKSHGLEYMEGPLGFSNLDKAGLLVEGFDQKSTMITLYNYEYYKTHLEILGFKTASEWIENYLTLSDKLPEKVINFSKIIKKRYNLSVVKFNKIQDMEPYMKPMFELLEKAYGTLESFVPISEKQIEYYKSKYLKILNPKFVNCIIDKDGNLCSFAITTPSYAEALQKAKGTLFPFGWYHLLTAPKNTDIAEYILIGIHPKYQKKGLTAIIFCEIFETFKKYGIKYMETNPLLVDNINIQLLWTDFLPVIHKRRRSYQKIIN